MNIRNRLTLLFILIVALIIIAASIAIYYFSSEYRREDFYNRLQGKGTNTAKLLIEVDEINAELLERIEAGNSTTLPNEKVIIYNFRNEVLYSTDKERVLEIGTQLLDRIRLEKQVRFEQDNYEVLGLLYADRYDRFVVVAAGTDIYGRGKLRNLRTILALVFGVSILVVLASGWVFAGRALKPISKVIQQADEINISSLNLRLDEGNGTDEIAQLSKAFNFVLGRLESSFEIQKNFIANASHELRTPLTAITGQLEVTLLAQRSTEEYKKTLQSVLDDIKHLNTLSNRLLLLAQTSQENLETTSVPIRIDEVLWQSKDDLQKRNSAYEIQIHFDESLDDEKKFMIRGDEQLVKVAVYNLLENGCKYSPDHRVEVIIKEYRNRITLAFTNASAVELSKDDLTKIFEPFHRGQNAKNIRGHGIGLSLVDRIVKMHGGQVKLSSKSDKVTFILRIPLFES